MEEQQLIKKKIKELDRYRKNHEKLFLERKNKIPEKFIENYLEIISELEKEKRKLKKINNERKDTFRTKRNFQQSNNCRKWQ